MVVTVGPPGLNVGLGLEIEVLNLGVVWQLDMSLEKQASSTRVGPYIGRYHPLALFLPAPPASRSPRAS